MSKIRVHELAKQLSIESKDLLDKLGEFGIKDKKHSNSLEENEVQLIMKHFSNKQKNIQNSEESDKIKPNMTQPTGKPEEEKQIKAKATQAQAPQAQTQEQRPRPEGTRPDGQRPAQAQRPVGRPRPITTYSSDRPNSTMNRVPPLTRPITRPVQPQQTASEKVIEKPTETFVEKPAVISHPVETEAKHVEKHVEKLESIISDVVIKPVESAAKETQPETAKTETPAQRPADRPYTPRPQGQGDRPYTPRPQGQSDRPYTPRPQGQGDRPYTPRPQGQGDRPYTPRPQGQGDRPYTPRPQGQGDRPYTPRPAGQGGYTPRPAGQGGYTPRPVGQGGYTPRPAGQGGYTPRPAGQGGYTPRPAGQGGYTPRPAGQGGYTPRPAGQGGFNKDKPGFDRSKGGFKPDYKSKDKPATPTIGKPEKEHSRRLIKDPVKKERVVEEGEFSLSKPNSRKTDKIKSNEPMVIRISQKLTLKELAEKMNTSGNELVKSLMKKGMMITLNQEIDFEAASLIAVDYDILVEEEIEIDPFAAAFEIVEKEEDLKERPPVVVVMGHVDHGKTSLLDAIRKSKVAAGEAGGITQHIGAYTVAINNKPITFLDTPGHEAFTAMRMRGAKATDIAVLVVAADDGVMPQTIEAINHAKAAGVEIIVAINKIDKPSANPDRVKRELTEHGIQTEDWGGETICVHVSAIQKTGIDQLLEMIILAAEIKELKANPNAAARGTVIEATLDKGKGPVATILVQNGTLNIGDPIVAGGVYGKIRAMTDDKGMRVKKATPSMPVEILGLPNVPQAGDLFFVPENEKTARSIAENIIAKSRVKMTNQNLNKVTTFEDIVSQIKAGTLKELNLIVKADVAGSVEALRQSLEKLSNEEVKVRIIHGGVGAVTETDVTLASTAGAIIIGFNVRAELQAKTVADEQKVDMRMYRVIYSAIEDVQSAMRGMLDPVFEERVIGHAEIRMLFKASGIGTIAGSYVLDGKFVRNCKVRITRDGALIYEGELESLKRFKDDVKEVLTNFECGLVFNKFNDLKELDRVEAYVIEEVERKL